MKNSNRSFEASVHVQDRPVKEITHRGSTYIEGRKGTEYTLHFKNNEHKRVLIIPSVDGLCTVDGKPAGRRSAGFIIEGHSSIDITGWTVDDSTAAKFTFWPQDARGEATYVEELSKSGANVDTGNQGLIGFLIIEEQFTPTLKFAGSISAKDVKIWDSVGFDTGTLRGVPISSSNTLYMSSSSNASSIENPMYDADISMGTKFGEAVEFNTTLGEFTRGRTVGEFIIEYDTLRGLKDRGVPVNLFKGTDKRYGTRSAFPEDTSKLGCKPPEDWKGDKPTRTVTEQDINKLRNLPSTVSAEFYMKNVLGWSDEMIRSNAKLLRNEQNG